LSEIVKAARRPDSGKKHSISFYPTHEYTGIQYQHWGKPSNVTRGPRLLPKNPARFGVDIRPTLPSAAHAFVAQDLQPQWIEPNRDAAWPNGGSTRHWAFHWHPPSYTLCTQRCDPRSCASSPAWVCAAGHCRSCGPASPTVDRRAPMFATIQSPARSPKGQSSKLGSLQTMLDQPSWAALTRARRINSANSVGPLNGPASDISPDSRFDMHPPRFTPIIHQATRRFAQTLYI
jgi:hypothetical protein